MPTLTDATKGYYSHAYQHSDGRSQEEAPLGTCAYTVVLTDDAASRHLVGEATHFVSHAWKYTSSDVVAALQSFEGEGEGEGRHSGERYYWFDCVSVDQHASQSYPRECGKGLVETSLTLGLHHDM